MRDTDKRLLTPAIVIAGCLALLLVLIALTTRDGAADDSAAIGFPIVLAGLAAVAVVSALVWKTVSKKKADSR